MNFSITLWCIIFSL